jgi:glyoxylase-like metal-dependent hydrolase (beta-lactamase superfamily II)
VSGSLSLDVFNSGYKPIPGGPGWPENEQATWPASTSTLIASDTDAILVDALLTTAEGERLAMWVKESGKTPFLVFITHGHGDHFFGAGPVLSTFPDAKLVVLSSQVAKDAEFNTGPEVLPVWKQWFDGQFDEKPTLPSILDSGEIDLEGHAVLLHSIGGADGLPGTIVQAPELETICSGDIVYNNIHMWLWNSTPESRAAWLTSIDAVAALKPGTIITGHRDPDAPDDDAIRVLDQSRQYIEDFEIAVSKSSSPPEVIAAMMEKYSAYGNPYTLFVAAYTQFGS